MQVMRSGSLAVKSHQRRLRGLSSVKLSLSTRRWAAGIPSVTNGTIFPHIYPSGRIHAIFVVLCAAQQVVSQFWMRTRNATIAGGQKSKIWHHGRRTLDLWNIQAFLKSLINLPSINFTRVVRAEEKRKWKLPFKRTSAAHMALRSGWAVNCLTFLTFAWIHFCQEVSANCEMMSEALLPLKNLGKGFFLLPVLSIFPFD